jgi:hypothetical protein
MTLVTSALFDGLSLITKKNIILFFLNHRLFYNQFFVLRLKPIQLKLQICRDIPIHQAQIIIILHLSAFVGDKLLSEKHLEDSKGPRSIVIAKVCFYSLICHNLAYPHYASV